MNKIGNLVEITKKVGYCGFYSKYFLYRDSPSYGNPNALKIEYNRNGIIQHIENCYADKKYLFLNAERTRQIGLIWSDCDKIGKIYPIPLTCYWGGIA